MSWQGTSLQATVLPYSPVRWQTKRSGQTERQRGEACMADEPQMVPAQALAVTTLETEKVNPATTGIDRMSALEIARVMNEEDAKVAEAIAQELPHIARAIEEIAARLRRGGRLIYVGAGTSG